jgi:hypothetical protein
MDVNIPDQDLAQVERLDTSKIINPEIKFSADSWFVQRNFNKNMYSLIPEESFDLRLPEGFSTPRENLEYQIRVHDNLVKSIYEGELEFGRHYGELDLSGLTKVQLLKMLDDIDGKFIDALAASPREIKVPWKKTPGNFQDIVWNLRDHEVYHLKSNRDILRNLKIKEPDEVKSFWG